MTDFKATIEQWEDAGAFASGTRACLLELRARIEALEAAEQHQDKLDRLFEQAGAAMMVEGTFEHGGETYRFKGRPEREAAMESAAHPASSLVERVAKGIGSASPWMHSHRDEARAAIREVATWLKQEGIEAWAADRLLEEVNRA
jgi:hypothetical protein